MTASPNTKGYLFATPLIVVLAAAVILPALYNTGLAFFKYEAGSGLSRCVGLRNFERLFAQEGFWNAASVTLLWVIGNVSLQLLIGMVVALALNAVLRL